jgi:hypothetical protein
LIFQPSTAHDIIWDKERRKEGNNLLVTENTIMNIALFYYNTNINMTINLYFKLMMIFCRITLGNQLMGVKLVDPELKKAFQKRYPDGNCMGPPKT